MFELLLIYLYGILFSLLILKAKFFKQFGIKPQWIVIAFVAKVVVGILYGYLHIGQYAGGDTWALFRQGAYQVYHVLYINPSDYLKLIFYPCLTPPPHSLQHYSQSISDYGDESYYLIVRFNAIVRLVSFGFYNVHVVFYNIITLIGLLYLIKFLQNFIKGKEALILIALTLFPGVAFWTSGIHKDGFALAAMSVLLYSIIQILTNGIRVKYIAGIILSLFLVTILREFILFILIPLVIAFAWTNSKPGKTVLKYILVIVVYYGIAFNIQWVLPQFNVLNQLAVMQRAFFTLIITGSTIYLPPFQPTVASFLSIVPYGILHCLIRPYIRESHSVFMLLCSVENTVLIVLSIVVFLFFREKKKYNYSFMLFCALYVFSLYALAGSLVCNLGALVRYKCTGVLFWLLLLIYILDWNRLKRWVVKD